MKLPVPIGILCIDETKLEDSFPDSQFIIENCQFPPFRRTEPQKVVAKLFM